MTYLLDTNVVSALRRRDRLPRAVAAWFEAIPEEALFLSVITLLEVEVGIRRKERSDPIQGAMLRRWKTEWVVPAFAGRILDVTPEIAEACATLHVPDWRPAMGSLIGATAMVRHFTVVTRNVGDFRAMPVAIFDPWSLPSV